MFRSFVIILAAVLTVPFPSASAERGPFGVQVGTEPLERVDPASPDFLPGFQIETDFGTIRSLPSRNAVELSTRSGTTNIADGLLCDGIPLRRPTGLSMDGSVLCIADTANRRIVRVPLTNNGPDHSAVESWSHPEFRRPIGLASGADELYISDAWSDRVFVLDQDGNLSRGIGQHGSQQGFLSGPTGITLHDCLLSIADSRNSRVQVFDPATGEYESQWGLHVIRPHEAEGHLHYPTGVTLGGNGDTMIVDEPWEDRIQIFRRAGEEETIPQRLPLGADDFIHYGPGIAHHDRLLAITDPDTHTVRIFDLSLDTPVLIGVVGGYGSAAHQFIHPAAVSFLEPTDSLPLRIAVADRGNARIAVYTIDWSHNETLRFRPRLASLARTVDLQKLHSALQDAAAQFPIDPVGICENSDGAVAVLDDANASVALFDARLRLRDSIPLPPPPAGKGSLWTSIRSGEAGELICVDSVGQRVVLLSETAAAAEDVPHRRVDLGAWCEAPTDAARFGDGLLIVDRVAHRLIEIGPDGQATHTLGRPGLGGGEFHNPESILPLDDGRIVIVDRGNHRLQFFDSDWSLETVAGPRLYIADAVIGDKPARSPPARREAE